MRRSLLTFCFAAAACGGGSTSQGRDLGTVDTEDTGFYNDVDADTDTDTDADTDTDTDTDADPECNHLYEPVDEAGWQKVFSVTYTTPLGTETGTETITGQGFQNFYGGSYTWLTELSLSSGTGYYGTVYVTCEGDGMYMQGWTETYTEAASGTYSFTAVNDPPRMYLPDDSVLGSVGSWDYDYVLRMTESTYAMAIDVGAEGEYVELGTENIDIAGSTYSAYVLNNSYTMQWEGMYGYGGFSRYGNIKQYWVEGLGMVKEEHEYNVDSEDRTLIKELTSFSGL